MAVFHECANAPNRAVQGTTADERACNVTSKAANSGGVTSAGASGAVSAALEGV